MMRRLLFVLAALLVWGGLPQASALAEMHQIQLGSTKSMEAAKYFTGKASKVLGCETYIVRSGNYYVAVVGEYSAREKAAAELMRIAKHYTAYISSYEEREILAAFAEGEEIPVASSAAGGGKSGLDKGTGKSLAAIRAAAENEAAALDRVIREGLADTRVENCVLTQVVDLQTAVFTTSCPLKELDPFGLKTEERRGKNVYFSIPALGGQKKVLVEERADNALVFSRAESVLLVRVKSRDHASVDKLRNALRERISLCAKVK
jgi:hypothetical protein